MKHPKLYEVTQFEKSEHTVSATVLLNAQHPIFKGHFPTSPVLPGVCQIEMLKEILQQAIGEKLCLPDAGSVKFLNVVEPQFTPELKVHLNFKNKGENLLHTSASIVGSDRPFLKFIGDFEIKNEC